MKAEEMRALNVEGLLKKKEEAHENLFTLRFRLVTWHLVNHSELPRAKKEIARLETVIMEKELGIR